MKRLIFLPLLFLMILCSAQFTKSGGTFLKSGNVFMTAPSVPPEELTLLSGLVGYWKLDEASGTVYDQTDYSNDGTNAGASQSASGGKIGGAATFFGVDSVNMGNTVSLSSPDTAGTITAWIYVTGSESYGMIASKFDFNNDRNGYGLWVQSGTHLKGGGASASASSYFGSAETTPVSQDEWHFVAMTWDQASDTINLYVDETVYGAGLSIIFTSNVYRFHLGESHFITYSNALDGIIDEVGIWNRRLTTTEIGELYNSGNGLTHPFGIE